MSEAAQIYVRYNGKKGRGLIANYYSWCYGERLVSRARYGIEWIIEKLSSKRLHDRWYLIRLSRILDTNFDMKDVTISQDIIKERLDRYPEDNFRESVFLTQQNDDGKLFIDICKDFVKYAFTDRDANLEHIMDAESYMVWNVGPEWRCNPHIEKDMIAACDENIKYLSEHAQLMTPEELEDFINCEYRDFLF